MRQGQTLAALLVVTLIIAIIAAFLYVGRQGETQRQRGQQQTTYGMALERRRNSIPNIKPLPRTFTIRFGKRFAKSSNAV